MKILILASAIVFTSMLFNNCGESNLKDLNSFEGTSTQSMDLNSELDLGNQPAAPEVIVPDDEELVPLLLKVEATATSRVKTNCTHNDSKIMIDIQNADLNTKYCVESINIVPTTSSHFGKTYYCDSTSKFKFLKEESEWAFDVTKKSWGLIEGHIPTRNSDFIPGMYRLVIRDSEGNLARSSWISIGRENQDNCKVAPPITPVPGLPSTPPPSTTPPTTTPPTTTNPPTTTPPTTTPPTTTNPPTTTPPPSISCAYTWIGTNPLPVNSMGTESIVCSHVPAGSTLKLVGTRNTTTAIAQNITLSGAGIHLRNTTNTGSQLIAGNYVKKLEVRNAGGSLIFQSPNLTFFLEPKVIIEDCGGPARPGKPAQYCR